jgi:cytochrome P450
MSDEQISDEVRTLSLAGYETVAEALSWSWYLLAGATEAESAVWAEVDGVATGERGIGTAELARLPWCRMVLAEAMRLYPPTWLFVRVAQRDDVLPSGVFVAAGSKLNLSQWVMHRNPRYFADPDRFDPRRFAPEAIGSRPRFTYLPFGAGRRLCIGEEFAWMQGVSIMASVARRFRLVLPPGQSVEPEPNVTLRPHGGLPMRLAAR